MSTEANELQKLADEEYKYGFVTDIEAEALPPGLSEDVIRLISSKKREPEWMLEWRLKAFRRFMVMALPPGPSVPALHLLPDLVALGADPIELLLQGGVFFGRAGFG